MYNWIKRGIVNTYCFIIDYAFVGIDINTLESSSKKKILITKTDAIGDFVIWSASAVAYKKIYPPTEYEIFLLANPSCKQLASNLGIIDFFVPFDRLKFMLHPLYRFSIWKKLLPIKFDIIINPSYSREFATSDLLIRKIKAKRKIGVRSDAAIDSKFWISLGDKYYSELIPNYKGHEILKNEAFIKAIGKTDFKSALPNIIIKDVNNFRFEKLGNYFVIAPGARIGKRQWGASNFAMLADYITNSTGWKGILVGSMEESSLCASVQKYAKNELINASGQTNLLELIEIIKKGKIYIGNETAGIHIAVAVKTPSLCILGGGHFGRFMPYPEDKLIENNVISLCINHHMPCYNCDWNCIYSSDKTQAVPCISIISAEKAIIAIKELLSILKHN